MTQPSPRSPGPEVWRRFAGMFGADSVARKFGAEIPQEWNAMLQRLNDHEIQRGIRQLAYGGKAHVPSLPEFVKLCRDAEHDMVASPVHPAIAAPEWDRWLIAGNRRLLRYITGRIPKDPKAYGDRHEPSFAASVSALVAMKNRWVELMQASATEDGVPPDEQKQCWQECMRQAEEIISAEHAA